VKTIVQPAYGLEHLELRDLPEPEPAPDEVVIRVHAAAVNPYDYYSARGPLVARPMLGMRRPKQLIKGVDAAGVVVAVGAEVTTFAPGDEVFGGARGSFAELARAKATSVARKPARLSFEQAAALPLAGLTAIQALNAASLEPGEHIAVTGATGGIGHLAVQIAKARGAEVTGTCRPGNEELLRSLGADHVVVYTEDNYLRHGPYDVILENGGGHSMRALRRALAPGGRVVPNCGADMSLIVASFAYPLVVDDVIRFMTATNPVDLEELRRLAEDGRLTPAIDRTYPLAQAADALRQLGLRHTRGKLVLIP
jgi:NADPH:quinone reductase-like Zn-dependent oxidoreductase